MSCRKFNILSEELTSLCLDKSVSSKSKDYLINKASNYIRRASFDIYQVFLSLDGFNNNGHVYVDTYKIDCHECTLYMCLVVD